LQELNSSGIQRVSPEGVDAGKTFSARLTNRKSLLRMLINRRTSEAQNSENEGQLMLDKMRARLNGRVATVIIAVKSGAKYETHYIVEKKLTPIKLLQRI